MDWTEIIIRVPQACGEAASAIAATACSGGIYIEDYAGMEQDVERIAHIDLIEEELRNKPRDRVQVHLYFSPEENLAPKVEELQNLLLAAEIPFELGRTSVRQEDWENSWKQYYHPMEIGKRLAVAPSWEPYEGKRTTIELDPGMAFGTGTHETTYLCLELLDELVQGGETLLDVGTGSGILAVGALLLGAESALGIDIDPLSVRTAKENAARNGVQAGFEARVGDLATAVQGRYDIITANIVAAAILQLAPAIPPLMKPGGLFIASGIIDEREQEVAGGLRAAGLQIKEIRRKNGWAAILASLPPMAAKP